jgi:hypothetical protein
MDGAKKLYQGISIDPQPQKLAEGEWKAQFTLEIHCGSVTDTASYTVGGTFPTPEEAITTAVKAARSVIDEL